MVFVVLSRFVNKRCCQSIIILVYHQTISIWKSKTLKSIYKGKKDFRIYNGRLRSIGNMSHHKI